MQGNGGYIKLPHLDPEDLAADVARARHTKRDAKAAKASRSLVAGCGWSHLPTPRRPLDGIYLRSCLIIRSLLEVKVSLARALIMNPDMQLSTENSARTLRDKVGAASTISPL